MRTITVERRIEATPDRVFDLIADHAGYDRFRGIRGSELLTEGDPPPNGVGAMRRILIGPLRFDEEITAYEPPTRLDYMIKRINAPFEHQGGSIRLVAVQEGTRAEWRSTFRIPIPVRGGAVERALAPVFARGFGRVLEDVGRMLAGSGSSS